MCRIVIVLPIDASTARAWGDEMTEISQKLRALRKSRKMTLKDVADKAGCTSAYISQLEKGRANPSIATLKKIASVFNVKMVEFFIDDEEEDQVVVRRDQRTVMDFNTGQATVESLVRSTESKRMQAFCDTVKPGGGTKGEYTHEGEEFGFVVKGELELTVGEKIFYLKEGDSFYYSSTKPHGYHNKSTKEAVVIWVITPPSF